jgi:hypothetical protein
MESGTNEEKDPQDQSKRGDQPPPGAGSSDTAPSKSTEGEKPIESDGERSEADR